MTSYPAFCDHILHQNELVAAGICHGDTWNLIFINNMLGEILKLSPGRMDDEPFLPRLTRCGFDEVEESLSEPHGGELIAHHKEGSMYIIRWKSVSIDDSADGEQVRLVTMSKIPVDQINRVAELPWQELTVLLDSIHDGIWVIDSDGITLRVNKAMERIAGLRAEEVIGKHVTEPMHKGRFETCVTLRALIEKRSVTMFDDYSNGKRCLNTSTPIFDEKGNVWRVIASIRDMTELETLQRKLTDLEMETLAYKARLENLETEMDAGFVGHSAPMRRLRKEASKAARTEAITLILGETGTGKTLTAKAIHDMGQRSAEPFIAVNCGAIPMSLMESELFGYEKGAFTGAAKSGKPGMFELAHKGTLLLDEIGELPLPMQAKLLQVLDGHPFHRVGGTKPITVDVRVIAATNRDLRQLAGQGRFREDLFYRLNAFPLRIPALRERGDDALLLARLFARKFSVAAKGRPLPLTEDAAAHLAAYGWPGNVRELENCIQLHVNLAEGDAINIPPLAPEHQEATVPIEGFSTQKNVFEKKLIAEALERYGGNVKKTASFLHVPLSTLYNKIKRYNLFPQRLKAPEPTDTHEQDKELGMLVSRLSPQSKESLRLFLKTLV